METIQVKVAYYQHNINDGVRLYISLPNDAQSHQNTLNVITAHIDADTLCVAEGSECGFDLSDAMYSEALRDELMKNKCADSPYAFYALRNGSYRAHTIEGKTWPDFAYYRDKRNAEQIRRILMDEDAVKPSKKRLIQNIQKYRGVTEAEADKPYAELADIYMSLSGALIAY